MDHFLSKKEKADEEEIVTLDVSFILDYIKKLHKDLPLEIMLLKFYKMKVDNKKNTLKEFKAYIKNKLNVTNDVELFNIINKNLYIKLTVKIKHMIDSLVNREYGCEVYDAIFSNYKIANENSVIIELVIKR